jgi:sulfatase maturation enzyme AslB (radical SAM superfamily)
MVVMRENIDHLSILYKYLLDVGVKNIAIGDLLFSGNAQNNFQDLAVSYKDKKYSFKKIWIFLVILKTFFSKTFHSVYYPKNIRTISIVDQYLKKLMKLNMIGVIIIIFSARK